MSGTGRGWKGWKPFRGPQGWVVSTAAVASVYAASFSLIAQPLPKHPRRPAARPRRIARGAPDANAALDTLTECRNCLLEHVVLVMLSGHLFPLSEVLLYALDEDDSVYAPTNGPRRRPTSESVPFEKWWAGRGEAQQMRGPGLG